MSALAVVEITKEHTSWSYKKKEIDWATNLGAVGLMTAAPAYTCVSWVALEYFGGSITDTVASLVSHGPIRFAENFFPGASIKVFIGYALWLLLQAFFYGFLPGPTCYGQRTPGGHLLSYCCNGLLAWVVTHALYVVGSLCGILDPALMARHWEGLFVAVNFYGFFLAFICYWKGLIAPSFAEDRRISDSWIYDYITGVELNPRFGEYWDFKFFHNGRPGIVAWTLIDISWAAYQYQTWGYVTKSMMLVILFHSIYVVDFFYNEDWYTRTLDISHDHFGFLLAWGDTTFLPTMYTLQAQYLARYPTHLSTMQTLALLALDIGGYAMFRSANHQRDIVRGNDGNVKIWGKPAEFIRCKYRTDDGKEHNSLLLTSGWWGITRHANYLADLMQAFAMCATCGFTHILPWFYFCFLFGLLVHRAGRDEQRCLAKYGKHWEKYCELVPYILIPGAY